MPEQLAGFLPVIVILAVFYFFMIRPQQKQRKERAEMLDSLNKGDKIVTIGGIYGTLIDVKEDTIKLRVADKVELTMSRESVGYKKD
ncbi:MAG: preprotein translocase subunit YajC [Firmicutes bacterium]|nr:preprotein translocase subunit YajC [Bacillota bacterium]